MTTFFNETIGFFAAKTSMHGVKNIVDSENRVMRAMWTVIVITTVTLAIVNGMQVTYTFMIKGSNTTTIAYNVHADTGVPLPMLTICPTRNPFLASRLKERSLSSNAAAFLLLMVDKAGNMGLWGETLEQQQQLQDGLSTELGQSLRDNETLLDLLNYLSPSCEEMIGGCYVYGDYMNGSTCCTEVFSEDYAVYYQGRCLSSRFSTLLLRKNQTQSGDYSGLSIILQEDKETFNAEMDMRTSMVPIQEGNRVILNPWYELPHDALSKQTYIADVGAVTRLAVALTTVDRTGLYTGPWLWSRQECVDIPRPWVDGQVTSDTCIMSRLRAAFRDRMNCTPLGMMDAINAEEVNNTTICRPQDLLRVTMKWTDAFVAEFNCPVKCQEVTLDATIDSTLIKQQVLEHSLVFGAPAAASPGRNLTFSVVMVFYPNLMTRQILLSQATFMEWLSAFGGQLSLFIGASVITMLEMTAFLVRVVMLLGGKVLDSLCREPREEEEGEASDEGEMKREMKKGSSWAQVEPMSVPSQ